LLGLGLLKLLCLVATLELAQQTRESFPQFLLLQENGHDNRFKWTWACDHDPSLDVQLGAVEEPVEDGLIGFWKCSLERCPAAALIFNEVAKRRKGFAHGIRPPATGATNNWERLWRTSKRFHGRRICQHCVDRSIDRCTKIPSLERVPSPPYCVPPRNPDNLHPIVLDPSGSAEDASLQRYQQSFDRQHR
jgi:hypothetical protein